MLATLFRCVHAWLDRWIPNKERTYYERSAPQFEIYYSDLATRLNKQLISPANNVILGLGSKLQGHKAHDAEGVEEEALRAFEQERLNLFRALDSAHRCKRWNVVTDLGKSLSLFLYQRSYWTDWLAISEQVLFAAQHIDNLSVQADASLHLGVVHRQLGLADAAARALRQSLEFYRKLGDREGEGLALGNLGSLSFMVGDIQGAIEHYDEALLVFREIKDQYGQAQALMGLGICLTTERKLDVALLRLNECLNIHKATGDRYGQAQALNNIGVLQRRRGQLDAAFSSIEASLDIKRLLGDRHGMAMALNNLAAAYEQLGDSQRARETWTAALFILDDMHAPEAERVARRLQRHMGH